MRLVVGLGNPGTRYARTRHNVGFMAVERLAAAAQWKDFEHGLGLWAKDPSFLLAKPLTYMNESGDFVRRFSSYYKVGPEETLIVFDDVALPLGRLRIRAGGSSGGQKGMESIIGCLGTQNVPRLRVGIGPQPAGLDSAAFVLQRFSRAEEGDLNAVLDTAAEAVRRIAAEGLDAAMNRYNPRA
ncbi:MAG: aminoacyl-tRNA hydrolase [Elusimicrobia bacterium]|nr:aminoacyl-tRNA hydrolase [Elusimicrobiota bacterium]MDE2237495.1 aminoacyl-tRNA hydrolase [Elusimicrobiota bacterium]MDE2425100.1 aminoacyl-tRNA hydrolase [Elusimicrobiota bacterium]